MSAASISAMEDSLLIDLRRMRGGLCEGCGESLCNHETLMCLVAGYGNGPRCLSCLSRMMGRGREEVRDHLLGYIRIRSCRREAWAWANREEGEAPDILPACLWPRGERELIGNVEMQELNDSPQAPNRDPRFDAEWDAGDRGCGEFVMDLRVRLMQLQPRQVLKITAHDAGVPEDLPAWCRMTGHKLLFANHPEYWIERREK